MTTTGLKKINQRNSTSNTQSLQEDYVAIEEPILITLRYFDIATRHYKEKNLTVIMRTPGSDNELIIGFLFNEKIINTKKDVISIKINDDSQNNNHVIVELTQQVDIDWEKITRSFASQSSCGICGKTSLNSLVLKANKDIDNTHTWLSRNNITTLISQLQQYQPLFKQSGGVQGAGYVVNNEWLCVYEDVGRHNAVDKVIGDLVLNNRMINKSILILSGRISFEIMQKAITAAIPVIIAIGAPSSLAISAAIQFNITLIGFTRDNQFNVYHGNQRIDYSHV